MRTMYRHILSFALSFINMHYSTDWLVSRIQHIAKYVVTHASAVITRVIPVAEWKLVERMHSMRVRTMLGVNMFSGRHPGCISPV